MWFVFYPIDVLYLDENKTIVEIKTNFKPWEIYYPKKQANYIVELEQGIIKQTKTKLNDVVSF